MRKTEHTQPPASPIPVQQGNASGDLYHRFQALYRAAQDDRDEDPFFSPVLRLALHIQNALENNDITLKDLDTVISGLHGKAVCRRAERAKKYLGPCARDENLARLEALIRKIAAAAPDFDAFQNAIGKISYGYVFTAHPTFSLTMEQSHTLAETVFREDYCPCFTESFEKPSLNDENRFACDVIGHLRGAWRDYCAIVFKVAAEIFPDRWKTCRPRGISIASWVGFDLDGRMDIGWTASYANRIALMILQLEHYQNVLSGLVRARHLTPADVEEPLTRLRLSVEQLRDYHARFSSYNPDQDPGYADLQALSRHLIEDKASRVTSKTELAEMIAPLLDACAENADAQTTLCILLSEIESAGLSAADVHFRINAAQVHNAVRRQTDLKSHPADPRFRKSYMDKISTHYAQAETVNVHFGDILGEKASARRLFMLIQQICMHLDSESPVRFLIAESESAFTVMSALYLARCYGVEDHIDICPLFETERALAQGSRILGNLLENENVTAYYKNRGKICIQTGYSDAGRFIGQVPAGGSIERLKERMIKLLAHHSLREEIRLVVFDTHGESVGRGAHPVNVAMRMAYLSSPHFLRGAKTAGIDYLQESSWQGGDGFFLFHHPDLALANLTRVLEFWLGEDPEPKTKTENENEEDPYYTHLRGAATEFLINVKDYQARLNDNPDYGLLLNLLGPNLLPPSGSRAVKRQSELGPLRMEGLRTRDMRAIPHNAILLQMGIYANVVSGFGQAIRSDPAFFAEILEHSPQFRTYIDFVASGCRLSSCDALKAYIDTLDPLLWQIRATRQSDPERRETCEAVAQSLETMPVHAALGRLYRQLYQDISYLRRALGRFESHGIDLVRAHKEETDILQAIRIAIIHTIFSLAMRIPDYSPQHELDRAALVHNILQLNIPETVEELRRIFPLPEPEDPHADYGERSTQDHQEDEGYTLETRQIFDPLIDLHKRLLTISRTLIHYFGFTG